MAKLPAAEIGLQLGRNMGITHLILQIDNQACIEVLNNETYQGGECYHILNNCRKLINSSNWNIHINHCYREGNKVVNKLVNIGVVQEERAVYLNVPPHEIVSLIQEVIMGVTTPRLIV